MVCERVEIPIASDSAEGFEKTMEDGIKLLAGAVGSLSVKLSRGVENPSKYLLLIEWDSVEAHVAFTKTPEFDAFRQLARPFYAGSPSMEHFRPLLTS